MVSKEGKPTLGGTCLNWGCIPSKTLLDASHKFHELDHGMEQFGISTGKVSIDVAKMMENKEAVVKQLTGGVSALLSGNGVDILAGTGKLLANKRVLFTGHDGVQSELAGDDIILGFWNITYPFTRYYKFKLIMDENKNWLGYYINSLSFLLTCCIKRFPSK